MQFYSSCVLILFSIMLTGCRVGPDYHLPKPPFSPSYTGHPYPKKTVSIPAAGRGGKAQYFIAGCDISGEWWKLFHSHPLNTLIELALANNPNFMAAEATLRQAYETLNAQIGTSMFPQVTSQLTVERQKFSGQSFGFNNNSIFNLFNSSVNVSYNLDLLGGSRREIESLAAQVQYQTEQLLAAYLTLTANVVTTMLNAASFEAQIKATQDLIQFEQKQVDIVQKQLELGGTSGTSLLAQQTQLAQTRASLPPLEKSLAQTQHALAVLVGVLPSQLRLPPFDLDKLTIPQNIPISIPSYLVRQRPDIRAAEALLHSASAQVGVATANLFPQLNLTGSYGFSSTRLGGLFFPSNIVWNFASQIMQPIFEGGSLLAKRRGAIAAYQTAAAQYKQSVLIGFQNVADALRALESDAKSLKAQKEAEITSAKSLSLVQQQLKLGGVSYLDVIIAELQYQRAKIGRIQAQTSRFIDTTALFQALGGGWWNRRIGTIINKERR